MKKLIVTMVVLAGLCVAGCAVNQPIQRVPYPVEEYARLPKIGTGSATVRGQGFLKTMIGEVRYAAGNQVFLTPVTSYSTQWYDVTGNWQLDYFHQYWPKFEPENSDPRIQDYKAVTTADGEGRFEFKNVPAGEYYLGTDVVWYVPQQYGSMAQGGLITKRITVEEGKEYNIILTR